jgi:hypothetical protein
MTVRNMVKTYYNRTKKKRGPKRLIQPRDKTKIKRTNSILNSQNQKVTANKKKKRTVTWM